MFRILVLKMDNLFILYVLQKLFDCFQMYGFRFFPDQFGLIKALPEFS